jgi:hypothetical protein
MTERATKVRLATLHQRQSQNGNTYLRGLIGGCIAILVRDPDADSDQWGEGWALLLEERQRTADKPQTSSPASPCSSQRRAPPRRQHPRAETPPRVSGPPMADDDISDLLPLPGERRP